jgi:uncharacterized protein with HEPN domain
MRFVPARDWKLRIEDILEAVCKIQHYTAGMTQDAFVSEQKTLDAVVYNFVLIGEAARYLPPEIEVSYPEVPWKEMRDMRNFLVHEYPGTDPEIIWKTVVNDLPPLALQLERVLRMEGGSTE